jgi:hypothetical protein
LGLGASNAGLSDDGGIETSDRETGFAGDLHVGWGFGSSRIVGYQGNVWAKDVEGLTWVFQSYGFSYTWYPGGRGFYCYGMLGVGSIEVIRRGSSLKDTGVGAGVGSGYEFSLSRKLGLGPRLDFSYVNIDEVAANYLSLGMVLNIYF